MSISEWLELAQTFEALVTAAGIIAAGYWAYSRFFRHREPFPSAIVEHTYSVLCLGEQSKLLQVQVHIRNTGRVLLHIQDMESRLLQVLPLVGSLGDRHSRREPLVIEGQNEVAWPEIDHRRLGSSDEPMELEPGETETFHLDYELPDGLEVVRIYSHLKNCEKANLGWACATNVNLRSEV